MDNWSINGGDVVFFLVNGGGIVFDWLSLEKAFLYIRALFSELLLCGQNNTFVKEKCFF